MSIPVNPNPNGAHAKTESARHVVIIGGGISGLSAAWSIQQQAARDGANVRCTVLESAGRWGGKVLTETVDIDAESPFIVEGGPDSFLTQKPWALTLARELGLAERLLGTNDQMRTVYVLNRGRPVPLPDGVLLIVPTKFMPFALSPLISPLAKLRMGLDLFIPARRDDRDETLAEFVRRRLGNEALDKIAEPLMSGIYNAEADKQSVLATFPRFRQLEREHGSLIRGMLASRRKAPPPSAAPKTSMFVSLRGGTQELIDALVRQLTADLRLNASVTTVERAEGSRWRIRTEDGQSLLADAVLLTVPSYTAARLLQDLAPAAAQELAAIRYVSTGTLSMAFRAQDIRRPLHGFGLVVPKSERRPINAITISSTKFDQRAPANYVLLRVFFGGSRSPETMTYDDARLLDVVRGELHAILGIEAEPLFHRIYRWNNANPQYDVNHLERIAAVESALPDGLYMTSSAMRGVGMPDCVYQAQQSVNAMMQYLQHATHEVNA